MRLHTHKYRRKGAGCVCNEKPLIFKPENLPLSESVSELYQQNILRWYCRTQKLSQNGGIQLGNIRRNLKTHHRILEIYFS